jgi:hypothetical protein
MPHEFNLVRRRLLGAAVVSMTAGEIVMARSMDAQSSKKNTQRANMMKPSTHTSFSALKQIEAGDLNVGYAEEGHVDALPVILLHGRPYDIYSYVDVAPQLASAGYRVIIPYLRGYGSTRFISDKTLRNGQQSVLAVDTIALMDALRIEKAIVAGFDWGARACWLREIPARICQTHLDHRITEMGIH